jgi:protein ImuA
LAFGALHELAPAGAAQLGAALGFALTIATLTAADQRILVIQTDFAAQESGVPYGPGLAALGLPMQRLLLLRLPRPVDLLAAFEEALKSPAVAVAIAELPETGAADLTATRRLSLAAREGGGLGLLLRHQPSPLPTAALTRWEVGAAPSVPDRFGGLGRTAFALSLIKNRRGPCGRFTVCWNHHECRFVPPLSLAVAATAVDRPTDAPAFARRVG